MRVVVVNTLFILSILFIGYFGNKNHNSLTLLTLKKKNWKRWDGLVERELWSSLSCLMGYHDILGLMNSFSDHWRDSGYISDAGAYFCLLSSLRIQCAVSGKVDIDVRSLLRPIYIRVINCPCCTTLRWSGNFVLVISNASSKIVSLNVPMYRKMVPWHQRAEFWLLRIRARYLDYQSSWIRRRSLKVHFPFLHLR